ncbi:lytic transglycosylase domain-containing protein [Porphyromonas sp.]|uniref:lytic transglycosylase domain-containing protein n=1 Tax=Porphyromonas sp. TaxID=1924944 RepID=UPI0026DB0E60|nr:lytic transglycosylase domain-containing protein [Porphyromonas sp.]MDO4770757.1 LysM peptidoglycan-binding domain-containing protein [Porphyromonas sp.]
MQTKSYIRYCALACCLLLGVSYHTQAQETVATDGVADSLCLPSGEMVPEALDGKLTSMIEDKYKTYFDRSIPSTARTKHLSNDEYQKRLNALNSIIPLTYNSIVHECIDEFVNKRSRLFEQVLSKSTYYFPMIEEELDKHNLPLELKYLAIVESALTPTAVSPRGATGIWQIMLSTGKVYGLLIDSLVDERRDPKRSTQAVCSLFKDLYALYGDWLLALASYNCGPGSVNKAIRKAGGAKDFWKIYQHLPRETRSYVPYFIAVYYAMEYYNDYDLSPGTIQLPLATDTVRVDRKYSFSQISKISGVSEETLMLLNPKYRKGIVPGHGENQTVILPLANANTFAAQKEALPVAQIQTKESTIYHKVGKRESLGSIAKKYGVDIEDIKSWNKLRRNTVRAGQRLAIRIITEQEELEAMPVATDRNDLAQAQLVAGQTVEKAPEPVKKVAEKKATKKTSARYHTVTKGQSLNLIAKKYKGVTVAKLKKANGLKNNKIHPGQKLIIP